MREFAFRKWDGRPHWVHREIPLGEDDCGVWIGQPRGWTSERPGARFVAPGPNVSVVAAGRGWVATFFGADRDGIRVYVDLVEDADPVALTAIDMDLDVIRDPHGVRIVDEDEFAEHRIEMGYPDDLVARVEHDARDVVRMIEAGEPPFDGRDEHWLAELARIAPEPH
jgi:protein associated with RNAse G/E